jgi:hypothetical protein
MVEPAPQGASEMRTGAARPKGVLEATRRRRIRVQ